MVGLGEFFRKVQNSFSKEIFLRSVIKDAIKNNLGLEISIENISFKNDTVILKNISQAAYSVIFIKKQAILKEIAEKQNIKKISDIRW